MVLVALWFRRSWVKLVGRPPIASPMDDVVPKDIPSFDNNQLGGQLRLSCDETLDGSVVGAN